MKDSGSGTWNDESRWQVCNEVSCNSWFLMSNLCSYTEAIKIEVFFTVKR